MFSFSVEPVSEVLCTVGHVNSIDPFDQSVAKYYNGWTKKILYKFCINFCQHGQNCCMNLCKNMKMNINYLLFVNTFHAGPAFFI